MKVEKKEEPKENKKSVIDKKNHETFEHIFTFLTFVPYSTDECKQE